MMRPVTTICLLMAAGSGLYLYQAKHQAQVETREIARLMSDAATIRQRIGVLVTEYQLENDPDRIGDLATRFLPQLKPTAPTQFTTTAELDKRLPPVGSGQPAAADPNDLDGPPVPPDLASVPIAKADPAHPEPLRADAGRTDAGRTDAGHDEAKADTPRATVAAAPKPAATQVAAHNTTPPASQPPYHPPAPRFASAAPSHDGTSPAWSSTPAIRPASSYANQLTTPVVSPVFASAPRAGYGQSAAQVPQQMGSSLGMARFLGRPSTMPDGGPLMPPGGSGG